MKSSFVKPISFILWIIICSCQNASAQNRDSLITVNIDVNKTAQTIDNIGASGCWFSEGIGKYWPTAKKEAIAKLLFSKETDNQGNPLGIGLSAWRFNIGAGTAEQSDKSGIKDFRKRTECFFNTDGNYDWNKQTGYQYFLQKAHDYGVETLIAFSNSPPVQFTKNGFGYKTEKDHTSNLRGNAYDDYTLFLANVLKHFENKGIHFSYISPVNEPQWDWAHPYGEADQEGSAWTNDEIFSVAKSLDRSLKRDKLNTNILLSEAGILTSLYSGNGATDSQIQYFFNPASKLSVKTLTHVPAIIAGHSYFTESNDQALYTTRKNLADTTKKYNVNYWQSEYSMLADGYREGSMAPRTAMDCALFLAKVINTDLTVGNATAWQFWNSYEPGNADYDTRYYLIALNPKPDFKDGEFTVTKNLWALGHYSLFVRPGMKRVLTDGLTILSNNKVFFSAFTDKNNGKLVMVIVNENVADIQLQLNTGQLKTSYTFLQTYTTSAGAGNNMKASTVKPFSNRLAIPARSIITVVIK